jgi:Ankyrin repeats (many copies)/Ankyrin repeat
MVKNCCQEVMDDTLADRLVLAMDKNDIQYIKNFLDKGGNVDTKYGANTLLFCAITRARDDIATLLVERGANVNAINGFGETILVAACVNGMPYKFIELLLEHDADPNGVQGVSKNTPLHLVGAMKGVYPTTKDKLNVLNILLYYGANVNAVNLSAQTPLDLVVSLKPPDVLDVAYVLTTNGAKVNPITADQLKYIEDNPYIVRRSRDGVAINTTMPATALVAPPSTKFFTTQQDILRSLREPERRILTTYTEFGDRITNGVLRGNIAKVATENPVLIGSIRKFMTAYGPICPPQINVKTGTNVDVGIVRCYVTEFMRVFNKIPVSNEELTVYRGVQRPEDINIHGNEFLSTSLEADIGRKFVNKKDPKKCCFMKITIKPGVRVMYMEPITRYSREEEILIGPPFKVTKLIKHTKIEDGEEVDTGTYELEISPAPKYTRGATRRRKHRKRKTNRRL